MRISRLLFYLVLGLVVFGLVMIGNASVVDALRDFGDRWYYLKLQTVWALVGLAGFFFTSWLDYRWLEKFANLALILAGVLLVAVLIPGVSNEILGARRWISLGFISFQPAEIAKLMMIVYWARILTLKNHLAPFVMSLVVVAGLVMLEPDLGTTVILIATALLMYFGSGASLGKMVLIVPAMLAIGVGLILISPYRRSRVATFLDYSQDPLGSSYHIRQVLLSLGSGGMWGVGLGQSRQKYEFLPEVTTDSIFAVVGEEMGLAGTTLLIATFVALFWVGLKIAREARDDFGRNLALGLIGWITLQALVNTAAMVALVPLTGIPLPFISYGGTSLVIAMVSCGILANISRHSHLR